MKGLEVELQIIVGRFTFRRRFGNLKLEDIMETIMITFC